VEEDLGDGKTRVGYAGGEVMEVELHKEVWERRAEGAGGAACCEGGWGSLDADGDSDGGGDVEMEPPPSPTRAQIAAAGVATFAVVTPRVPIQQTICSAATVTASRAREEATCRGRVPRMCRQLGVSDSQDLGQFILSGKRSCTQRTRAAAAVAAAAGGSGANEDCGTGAGAEDDGGGKRARVDGENGSQRVVSGRGKATAASKGSKDVREIAKALTSAKQTFTVLTKKFEKVK
jgi:hypothetical protein